METYEMAFSLLTSDHIRFTNNKLENTNKYKGAVNSSKNLYLPDEDVNEMLKNEFKNITKENLFKYLYKVEYLDEYSLKYWFNKI